MEEALQFLSKDGLGPALLLAIGFLLILFAIIDKEINNDDNENPYT